MQMKSAPFTSSSRNGDLWTRQSNVSTGRMLAKRPNCLRMASRPCSGRTGAVGVVVVFGVAYGREQDGIGVPADAQGLLGKRIAGGVDGRGAAQCLLVGDFVSELVAYGGHHGHSLCRYFGAYTVAGEYCNFQFHGAVVLF